MDKIISIKHSTLFNFANEAPEILLEEGMAADGDNNNTDVDFNDEPRANPTMLIRDLSAGMVSLCILHISISYLTDPSYSIVVKAAAFLGLIGSMGSLSYRTHSLGYRCMFGREWVPPTLEERPEPFDHRIMHR